MRILIANRESTASYGLALVCKNAKMVTDVVGVGTESIELARRFDYDTILLAATLPDMNAIEVIRRMRRAGIDTPVLVLVEHGASTTIAELLGAGADDCLSIPFDADELVARIRAIIRRARGHSSTALKVGQLELDMHAREARLADSPVPLTGKEVAVLELLMLRRNSPVSKETLMSHLYNGIDGPELKVIDVFVCKIRSKLAKAGASGVIVTVWGIGYMIRDTVVTAASPTRLSSAQTCRQAA